MLFSFTLPSTFTKCHYSGNGLGNGVERAVLREAILIATADGTFWKHLNDLGHVTWANRLDGIASNHVRLASVKAHGALVALHLVWLGSAPEPISPWLLLFTIAGFPSLLDPDFVASIDPNIGQRLAQWPLDLSAALSTSPLHLASLLITEFLGMAVCISYPLLHESTADYFYSL
jgi:hypothetical protein